MARFLRSLRYIALVGGILGALYLATRLLNLTLLPIFTDEAIYIRWSQIGTRDAAWRFISLVDGKQPMFTWIMMVFLRVIRDPLTAGRLVSVFAGALSLVGIWVLSFELFKNKKISLLTSFLYIISPFTLMYDRLSLYDSLVATFFIWNLYLGLLLVKHIRLDVALILGLVLGAGMLNKSSGFLSLYLLPATLILFDWKGKNRGKRLLSWIGLALVSAVLSQMVYALLRLAPLYHMIGLKDTVFIYSFGEWLSHPFKFVQGNLRGLFDWVIHYLTWPVFAASLLSLFVSRGKKKEILLLLVYWFAPFFALAMLGRVLYPRFVLFMSMPLLILAGVSAHWLLTQKWRFLGIVFFILGLMPGIYINYYILTNPLYAPIPFSDRSQLIDDWPSGWGVKEVNAYVTKQSEKGEVAIYTEGTFGLFPYAIEMYQVDNPKVTVKGIWPVPQEIPADIEALAREASSYIVFNQTQEPPPWPIELVEKYQKGNRKDVFLRLYKIVPADPKQIRR